VGRSGQQQWSWSGHVTQHAGFQQSMPQSYPHPPLGPAAGPHPWAIQPTTSTQITATSLLAGNTLEIYLDGCVVGVMRDRRLNLQGTVC
jgi:hypothetical protein